LRNKLEVGERRSLASHYTLTAGVIDDKVSLGYGPYILTA